MNNENYNGIEPPKNHQAPVASMESLDITEKAKNKSGVKATVAGDEAGNVTFTKGGDLKNGESIVNIGVPEVAFSGMGKDELMKYANDPFWVRLRWTLFILFWSGWIAMLAGAIIIVIIAPKCAPTTKLEYWQEGAVYEIYTPSFQDGGIDGFGDLKGITERLDHLSYLGVNIVLLSSIFKTAPSEMFNGVINFFDIDSKLGSLEDFTNLVEAAKKKKLKIVLDMTPNYSSDEHPWFTKSVNSEGNFSDYYVWKDGRPGAVSPPNNWLSISGGSAWTYNETRKQWYLHQFGLHQPDLNYRNEAVSAELLNVLHFWLSKGVAGFRLNGLPYLLEDKDFRDEPSAGAINSTDYDSLQHIHTLNLDETFDLVAKIRDLLNSFETDGESRVLFVGSSPVADARYFGNQTSTLTDFSYSYSLIDEIAESVTGQTLNTAITTYLKSIPDWAWPNWAIGNPDKSRVASRLGADDLTDAMAMMQLLLPGTPTIYYGEEIGMEDASNSQLPEAARTPMQWSSSNNAGFSPANQTWLPVGEKAAQVNVEIQTKEPRSHLHVYQKLLSFRKERAVLHGEVSFPFSDTDIFSFTRILKGSPGFLVVVNVGEKEREVDFSSDEHIPPEAIVVLSSAGGDATKMGMEVKTSNVKVGPNEGLVLSIVPNFKE